MIGQHLVQEVVFSSFYNLYKNFRLYHHHQNSIATKSFRLSNVEQQRNLIHKRQCEIDDRMSRRNPEFYKNVVLRSNQEL